MKKDKVPHKGTFNIINIDRSSVKVVLEQRGELRLVDTSGDTFATITRSSEDEYTLHFLKPILALGRPDKTTLTYWLTQGLS